MKRRRRARGSGIRLWIDAIEAGWATWATLSVRVPQVVAGTMTPRETHRMVAEKVAAATEGATKGSMAMARIGMRGVRPMTPRTLMADAVEIAEAVSAPAQRRVKANAKRLSDAPRGTNR